MNSWKTTAAGAGSVLTGLGMLAYGFANGDMSHFGDAIGFIFAGFGLGVAKDFNVTNAAPGVQAPAAVTKQ